MGGLRSEDTADFTEHQVAARQSARHHKRAFSSTSVSTVLVLVLILVLVLVRVRARVRVRT